MPHGKIEIHFSSIASSNTFSKHIHVETCTSRRKGKFIPVVHFLRKNIPVSADFLFFETHLCSWDCKIFQMSMEIFEMSSQDTYIHVAVGYAWII